MFITTNYSTMSTTKEYEETLYALQGLEESAGLILGEVEDDMHGEGGGCLQEEYDQALLKVSLLTSARVLIQQALAVEIV